MPTRIVSGGQVITLIDSRYIYLKERMAAVHFHRVKPVRMVDLLSGVVFDTSDPSSVEVDIPCGLFRRMDIELAEPLQAE